MDVHSSAGEGDGPSLADQAMHVSAYVDLSIDAVLDRFVPPQGDELLAAAVRAVLGGADDVVVVARAAAPVWVSSSHVRVPVTWSVTGSAGPMTEGEATISLLVVQSGDDAITELLATVPTPDASEGRSTVVLHDVLDELTSRIEASAP